MNEQATAQSGISAHRALLPYCSACSRSTTLVESILLVVLRSNLYAAYAQGIRSVSRVTVVVLIFSGSLRLLRMRPSERGWMIVSIFNCRARSAVALLDDLWSRQFSSQPA